MKADAAKNFQVQLLHARLNGREAMQELAENHLPLVAAMVRRFPQGLHEKEELYQQGCIGLMKAFSRFDPSLGTAFSTYAAAMILGEMRSLCRLDAPVHIPRGMRELRIRLYRVQQELTEHLHREPNLQELSTALRMDPGELVMAMEQITVCSADTASGQRFVELLPDQTDWETSVLLRNIITTLPRKAQRLLLLRYRFGLTQAEAGRRLGMSQVQVSRMEQGIKQKLRKEWTEE